MVIETLTSLIHFTKKEYRNQFTKEENNESIQVI